MIPGRSELLASAKPPEPSTGGSSIHTGFCRSCLEILPVTKIGEMCHNGPKVGTINPVGSLCGEIVDREWPVSPMEDGMAAAFEREVRRRARKVYIELEREDPEEATKMRQQYTEDAVAGMYNWDDQGVNVHNHVRAARLKYWGIAYAIYLMLQRCDPSVTQETAEKVWLANTRDSLAEYFWALGIVGNSESPPPESEEKELAESPPRRSAAWRRALKNRKLEAELRQQGFNEAARAAKEREPSANGSTHGSTHSSDAGGSARKPESEPTFD